MYDSVQSLARLITVKSIYQGLARFFFIVGLEMTTSFLRSFILSMLVSPLTEHKIYQRLTMGKPGLMQACTVSSQISSPLLILSIFSCSHDVAYKRKPVWAESVELD